MLSLPDVTTKREPIEWWPGVGVKFLRRPGPFPNVENHTMAVVLRPALD